MLPPDFVQQMQSLLGPAEWPDFEAALAAPPPVSIRLHPAKRPTDLALLPTAEAHVAWHPDGRYLPERPVFTLDPLHHAGAYYVQEASSMFLYEAVRQSVDFSKTLKIIDLCAAPGGKTTLLATLCAGHDAQLTANEVIRSRTPILRDNLERWGASSVVTTSAEADELATALTGRYDLAVVDAPCSGEGLFRKDPDATREWSPESVSLCAARQRRILQAAADLLAPDGVLVYSTCTYNRAENEDNVAWLCHELSFEKKDLHVPAEWGITATDGGYRFMPHRTRGEGFFLSVLKKKGGDAPPRWSLPTAFRSLTPVPKLQTPELRQWVDGFEQYRFFQTPTGEVLAWPATDEPDLLLMDKSLKMKWFGCRVGAFKGKDLIPDHALAMSHLLAEGVARLDLSREQALIFLKKETFDVPEATPRGWAVACYGGLPLGWVKVLPNRLNNYLPPERRIRMEVR
jgi:16S rRNA C967 or C1407 C5-methylase (RsmB/RsmF family)/NOL1/NOP2/fmu family ribosome biogenesis protein